MWLLTIRRVTFLNIANCYGAKDHLVVHDLFSFLILSFPFLSIPLTLSSWIFGNQFFPCAYVSLIFLREKRSITLWTMRSNKIQCDCEENARKEKAEKKGKARNCAGIWSMVNRLVDLIRRWWVGKPEPA